MENDSTETSDSAENVNPQTPDFFDEDITPVKDIDLAEADETDLEKDAVYVETPKWGQWTYIKEYKIRDRAMEHASMAATRKAADTNELIRDAQKIEYYLKTGDLEG